MSGAAQDVRKALLKLAQTWPKDPLRPNLDFGEAIRRATEVELSSGAARVNIAEARKSLAALERIRSSESLREYPTPRNVLHPASSPNYYGQLVEAMGRVARGQSVAPSLGQRMRRFFGM
ncbi:acetylornithine transaminase [Malassezia japonica]|uniref:Acetylornithine transaminase n=1 Tax=Malassezia japonica TaxID=223818 RepID=A0AAF0F4J2_9BASI|nr:acetylornithine transaminase [Malassezia japonica]WFD38168.1 acetylornithine transaminase [Malassezia japonica]